jgi:hypothetical protein
VSSVRDRRLLADQFRVDQTFGTVQCTLLDRRSSVPVRGARVTCLWRDQRVSVMRADERGAFVAELPEGVYDLVISARGYLSLFVRGIGVLAGYRQALVRGLVPGEGQAPDGQPSTAIGGYVRDRIGRTVPNVAILVNAGTGGTSYTTSTDNGGAYVLHGVVPGMYDLFARRHERTLAHEHVAIAHVNELVRRDLRLVQI